MKRIIFCVLIFSFVAVTAFAQNRLQSGLYESSSSGRVTLIYIGDPNANGSRTVVFMDANEKEIFRGTGSSGLNGHLDVFIDMRTSRQMLSFVNSSAFNYDGRRFTLFRFN